MQTYRIPIIALFGLLAVASGLLLPRLQFSFDFEQFFPEGDEDLAFFRDFVESFEADDNFMLIALARPQGVFDSAFLQKVHDLTLRGRDLPYVQESQSLTKFGYPVKTPFAVTTIPVIHLDQPDRYASDRERVLADERFVDNFINRDATTLLVYLKTAGQMTLEQSREFMAALDQLLAEYDFPEVHRLGRPYFQRELVAMQIREVVVSAIVSALLVSLVMFLIFRRPWGIAIALTSIGLGMLIFFGFLSATGREMSALAALYPVLMIIVGTSDVIHIMSKYIDELRKGEAPPRAIYTTVREIGLATLLTSLTTAVGFITLLTSRIAPIRDFGINAAIGVIVAYLTVILFTIACLSFFSVDQLVKTGRTQRFWDRLLANIYHFTRLRSRAIAWGGVVLIILCAWGISRIATNYNLVDNLPRGRQITEDFQFFERELAGFRPLEFAVLAKPGHRVDDYAVLTEIGKLEDYLHEFPFLRAIASVTAVYKSLNQMRANNNPEAYRLPETEAEYERFQRLAARVPQLNLNVLVNEDRDKARITSRINDIGADSIKQFGRQVDEWVAANIDTSLLTVKRTGTGLIVDKNSEYVRESLLQGLGLALLIISVLMGLLFRNWRMLLISLVPNIVPLLLAGALLGFLGIDLEAGISIVFAVIFGIAVDDTIHFLSKYKLVRLRGLDVEESIRITFQETGKAIVLTTIILFFGFLVMLFSIHPPSVTIGLLISLTLLSAVVSDLLLLPLLIRRWL